jgi:hypothetical protein
LSLVPFIRICSADILLYLKWTFTRTGNTYKIENADHGETSLILDKDGNITFDTDSQLSPTGRWTVWKVQDVFQSVSTIVPLLLSLHADHRGTRLVDTKPDRVLWLDDTTATISVSFTAVYF